MPPLRCVQGVLLLACLNLVCSAQTTDPRITSWVTANSAKYARLYETASDKTSGNAVSTWPRSGLTNGGGGQATATYSDVQRVVYSTNYVYIYTTGLPSYAMGNWVTPTGSVYTSWPTNRGAIHRIPRTPSIPTTKQKTNGSGGVLVNGVYVWANGDAQSYNTSTGVVSMQGGQGIWNRLAGVAEAFNFDPAYGHQPSNGAYHNHVNPIALRYQLGDSVTYNASTKTYSEATPTRHSPLIGWANDGLPIYGPYGYSSAMDATSGIRRMLSGFQKRDGTNGTTNLASTGRTTLPVWAASVQGKSQTLAATEYGPTTTATYQVAPGVTGTYSLGIFAEDYEYLGDVGRTQGVDFDLNRQNVRFCVTPEFPSGTYAYFVCIDASGTTVFPDIINQEFFGTAAMGQGTVTSISESVTEYIRGGPSAAITVTATASGANVALAWNSAEGATYKVESSPDNSTWTTLSSTITSGGTTTNYSATMANYHRITLTAIATYDTNGTFGTAVGTTGSVTYAAAATAPSITTHPVAVTVTAGGSATFAVVATGTAPLNYGWRRNNAAIAGATLASYTIASVQAGDAGSYSCVVTNSAGSSTSNAATLTVNAAATAPTITTHPANASVLPGGSATFTVAASGTGPLTYQWRKNGAVITGATAASYAIPSAQVGDAGSYACVVTNSAGSATSSSATLTVNTAAVAPVVTTHPANITIVAGSSATFTVVASGTTPLTYQWQKNSAAIAGATAASYTISSAQAGDAASYRCVVTNSAGTATSNAATLTISASAIPPGITTHPSSASLAVGGSVTFSVTPSGTGPFTYQWSRNSSPISGATAATLTINNATAADAGTYLVVVTNSVGVATSNAATLSVGTAAIAPTISTEPADAAAGAGASVTFTVAASGTAPLSYEWRKDGVAIAGAAHATLALTNIVAGDAALYSVVVTNSAGSATSRSARLTVRGLSYAGAYFGTFAGGTFALHVRSNNTGTFLGYAPSSGVTIVARNVTVDDTGRLRFTAVQTATAAAGRAAATTEWNVDATISGSGAITGTISGGGSPLTMLATRSAGTGAAATFAGLYEGGATGSNLTSYTIIGADGRAFVMNVAPGRVEAGSGTVDATGRLTGTTNTGTVVSATISGASATLVATVTSPIGVTTSITSGAETRTSVEKLGNLSTRGNVSSSPLIVGFVVGGDAPKTMLVRAVGPTLTEFGLGGALPAVRLELFRGETRIAAASDWNAATNAATASASVRVGAFALPAASRDAALLVNLEPGGYSAVVTGADGATGVALIEVYDAAENATRAQRLVNLATRAGAGSGDSTLIAGFVISGAVPKRLLVRGVGPTLGLFGVPDVLADPELRIQDSATVTIAANNDWSADAAAGAAIAAAAAQVGGFPLNTGSKDAAILLYLAPGAYTAQVIGVGDLVGTALVEVYEVP